VSLNLIKSVQIRLIRVIRVPFLRTKNQASLTECFRHRLTDFYRLMELKSALIRLIRVIRVPLPPHKKPGIFD
jgi:hypothetical protein